MKPRVLFVARTRYRLPLSQTLERRFAALSAQLDWHQLGSAADGRPVRTERFTLYGRFPLRRLDGMLFYARLPLRIARAIRRHCPDVVVVQGAQDTALSLAARRLAGVRVPVVFDVHGDWRNDTRVYGSRLRRLISPVTDALARYGVRHADGVRTVSTFTTSLVRAEGVQPAAVFPAYMDLAPFTDRPRVPLPERPAALFVGVLERYKGVDVLTDAWRDVARQVPDAELHVVGKGPLSDVVEKLVAAFPGRVRWTPELSTDGVVEALDDATALVLPSRGEGMGRVVVEAFCRGRAVVGTAAGGIPDLVENGASGLLVPVEDAKALADALVRVLGDGDLAGRLGAGAAAAAPAWIATPDEFAGRMRRLIEDVLRGNAGA